MKYVFTHRRGFSDDTLWLFCDDRKPNGVWLRNKVGELKHIKGATLSTCLDIVKDREWKMFTIDTKPIKVTHPKLKPNGQPDGTYLVSIDDGWVEYQYKVEGQDYLSIDRMYRIIAQALRAKETEGTIRTYHG